MRQQATNLGTRRAGRLIGLLLLSTLLSLLAFSSAQAQETVVRIQIEGVQPVESGDEFQATVLVENVEHLAGFNFTIGYDPERVKPVEEEASGDVALREDQVAIDAVDVGQFITQNGERQDMICDTPKANPSEGTATVSCVTVGPPLCLGGDPGASGSGVLGRVLFESKGGGPTTLELVGSTLVLDDLAGGCDPNSDALAIEHLREDASVELIGGSGGSGSTVAIVVGVVVALAVVAAGGAGLVWYRRRGASST